MQTSIWRSVRNGFWVGGEVESDGWNSLHLPVGKVTYQGSLIRYQFDMGDQRLIAELANRQDMVKSEPGETVRVSWPVDSGRIITE